MLVYKLRGIKITRYIVILLPLLLLLLLYRSTLDRSSTKKSKPYTFIPHNGTLIPPLTWPILENLFEGKRAKLLTDLTDLCRHYKVARASECSGHHHEPFKEFLRILSKIYYSNSDDKSYNEYDIIMNNSFTSESWDAHCKDQKKLNDARDYSICVAASYVSIPFPLKPNHALTMKQSDVSSPIRPQLITVTVLSTYNGIKGITTESSCRRKLSIHVLGVGDKNFYNMKKLFLYRDFLNQIPISEENSTVILFLDGTDTLIQSDSDEIISRFLSLNTRIVFSSEHGCYPMKYWPWNLNLGNFKPCKGSCSNSRYICDYLFKNRITHGIPMDPTNKWLNSGGYIGYLYDMKKLLDIALEIPYDMMTKFPGEDQGFYTYLLLSGKFDLTIDFESKLFLSFGLVGDPDEPSPWTSNNIIVQENKYGSSKQIQDIIWTHGNSSYKPSIIHFNADGKSSKMIGKVKKSFDILKEKFVNCDLFVHPHKNGETYKISTNT